MALLEAFWRRESRAETGGHVWTQKDRGCEVVVGTALPVIPGLPGPHLGPASGTCVPRNECLTQVTLSKPESLACPAKLCPLFYEEETRCRSLRPRVGPRGTGGTRAGRLALQTPADGGAPGMAAVHRQPWQVCLLEPGPGERVPHCLCASPTARLLTRQPASPSP